MIVPLKVPGTFILYFGVFVFGPAQEQRPSCVGTVSVLYLEERQPLQAFDRFQTLFDLKPFRAFGRRRDLLQEENDVLHDRTPFKIVVL